MITPKKETLAIPSQKEEEITCNLCNQPAMCNKFICYKMKKGLANCNACDERLCQKHWRIYFKRNI